MNTAETMNALASGLDEALNDDLKGADRKVGFALLIYEFGTPKDGRVNYVGNGQRDDVRMAIKELLARWEGRYAETETAQ